MTARPPIYTFDHPLPLQLDRRDADLLEIMEDLLLPETGRRVSLRDDDLGLVS